jgi:hypothetical protein
VERLAEPDAEALLRRWLAEHRWWRGSWQARSALD